VSEKHVIAQNKLHKSDKWRTADTKSKEVHWKWARTKTAEVRKMEEDMRRMMEGVEMMSLEAKKNKKAEIQRKTVDAINKCKEHGGPTACPKRLKELTTDQLKNEIALLKITNGQHIRYKHKVGNKFVFFKHDELLAQVLEVVAPEAKEKDLSQLLKGL